MKRSSILVWALSRFAGWTAVAIAVSVLFFATCIIGSSRMAAIFNGHWPDVTGDDLTSVAVLAIWVGGDAFLLFGLSLGEELLRRRNFDIETVRNDEPPKEPFSHWAIKIFLLYLSLAVALPGGSLLFVPLLHVAPKDYITDYGMMWKISLLVWALLFICRVLFAGVDLWFKALGLRLEKVSSSKDAVSGFR